MDGKTAALARLPDELYPTPAMIREAYTVQDPQVLSGLFSEINLGSDKLGKTYADRNAKLCSIITKIAGQDTSELFFQDCRVPVENLLGGEEGRGFYQLMQNLQQERLCIAVSSIASCRRALDDTVQYVKERKAFGKPIAGFQNTQFKLAEMATEVEVGQAFIDRLLVAHVRGDPKGYRRNPKSTTRPSIPPSRVAPPTEADLEPRVFSPRFLYTDQRPRGGFRARRPDQDTLG